MAQSPVLILGGGAATVLKGRGSLQDIDQLALMRSIVKDAFTLKKNCDILPVFRHAFTAAQSGIPGPVFVECPIDLLYDEDMVRMLYGVKSIAAGGGGLREKVLAWYLRRHVDRMFSCDFASMEPGAVSIKAPGLRGPSIRKAAEMVKRSERPVLVVGSQSMLFPGQAETLARSVDAMNIPVYLTGMARGLLGREHRLLMRHRRRDALREADLALLAGMPCDFRLNYGRDINAGARLIAVNRSRRDLYLNRRPDLAVHSDPFLFICALSSALAALDRRRDGWLETLRRRDDEREVEIGRMAEEETPPMNPLELLRKIDAVVDETGIMVADGGDFISSASYILHPRGPLSWLDPGVFGTLGCGAGFALGAGLVKPGTELWALFGDGALGYGLTEFDSFVRHGVPVIAVAGNDAGWSQIARDQVEYLHDDVGTVLARSDYHTAAAGLGAHGLVISHDGEIDAVLAEAKRIAAGGKPVLINAHIGRTEFRKGSISM
jgi:acetolactate synthase-1/2/3 large subunit